MGFIYSIFIYVIICVITSLTTITCNVIPRTNTTLQENSNNKIQNIIIKEHTAKIQNEESNDYLEDLLVKLQNQNWTAVEKPCLDQIYSLIYNLRNFTLWAVWEWDALPKEPQGVLFGNKYQLGNFDQCMEAPWSKTHPYLKTQYCLADIVLERADKAVHQNNENPTNPYESAKEFIQYNVPHTRAMNELTWGVCVPSVCAPRTVERFVRILLARSHLGSSAIKSNISIKEKCQTSDDVREYDGPFYAFFAVMGLMTIICLICTYFNCQRKQSDPVTTRSRIVKAFCIKSNATELLQMRKGGIDVLYGIRFLTLCPIVIGHQIITLNLMTVSDGFTIDQVVQSLPTMLYERVDLFVDSFFMISGFLTITYLANLKSIPYIVIVKRYFRLIVAYAVVIFYVSAVFPYTGSGPLWIRGLDVDSNECRKNWWLNLLMVSNYIDSSNMCMVTSWYIPCDFHFFIVVVLIYDLYKKWPKLGAVLAGLLTTVAVILPGIINYMNELSPAMPFTIDVISNPRASHEYQYYIKSHMRFAPYLIGFFSGMIYMKYRTNGNHLRMKQKWSTLGACSAIVTMFAVMLLGGIFLWGDFGPLATAVFAALHRPLWTCCLALIVISCAFGHVPLIKSFLSWYPWVPLSRLSYGLYLVHPIMQARLGNTARNPNHNDFLIVLNAGTGAIFWGCVASLLLWLLTEGPVNNLVVLLLKFGLLDKNTPLSVRHKDTIVKKQKNHLYLQTAVGDQQGNDVDLALLGSEVETSQIAAHDSNPSHSGIKEK